MAGMAADLLISIGIVTKVAGGHFVGAGIVDPEVLAAHNLRDACRRRPCRRRAGLRNGCAFAAENSDSGPAPAASALCSGVRVVVAADDGYAGTLRDGFGVKGSRCEDEAAAQQKCF